MKSITVFIDEKGNLVVDFSGFEGDRCVQEDNNLKKILLKYGVVVTPRRIVLKKEEGAYSLKRSFIGKKIST